MLRAAIFAALALCTAVAAPVATRQNETHEHVWDPAFFPAPSKAVTVVFRDFDRDKFATTVYVGTPPQPVTLLAGLTISDLLVLNHKVEPRTFYDHAKSSTYHANGTSITCFVDREVFLTGFASRDRVTLVGTNDDRIVVDHQLFMELDGPDKVISELPPNVGGVVGFGPRAANSTGTLSILHRMMIEDLLERPALGIRFDDAAMHATFGGVDAAFCDDNQAYFTQDAATPGPWWTVPLSAIHVNGSRVVGDGGRALVIDYIEGVVGPTQAIEKLALAVGVEDETHRLPCDGDGPDLELHLGDGDAVVTLTKSMYTLPTSEEGLCFFAFTDYKHGPLEPPTEGEPWAFGLGVLRHVCTVLDLTELDAKQRISFAKLKHMDM
jgi:hypothetical protein